MTRAETTAGTPTPLRDRSYKTPGPCKAVWPYASRLVRQRLPRGNRWQWLETFWVVTAVGRSYWHLGVRPWMLLSIPQCTGQTPTTENYLPQMSLVLRLRSYWTNKWRGEGPHYWWLSLEYPQYHCTTRTLKMSLWKLVLTGDLGTTWKQPQNYYSWRGSREKGKENKPNPVSHSKWTCKPKLKSPWQIIG